MLKLTAVIISYNAETTIAQCLESVQKVADEIIVVDSFSTDGTENICKQFPLVTFQSHAWEGYSPQKNYANSLSSNDWILSIDSDETLDASLIDSINAWKALPEHNPCIAYKFKRKNFILNRHYRCLGPDWQKRLFNRQQYRWNNSPLHETICTDSPNSMLRPLSGSILHYHNDISIIDNYVKTQLYCKLWVDGALAKNKKTSILQIHLKTAWAFFRFYILKLGILDGPYAYILCKQNAYSVFIRYSMLYEQQKGLTSPK